MIDDNWEVQKKNLHSVFASQYSGYRSAQDHAVQWMAFKVHS